MTGENVRKWVDMKQQCLNPQAMRVYKLLMTEGAMTAKEIGKRMKIFPQGVYREVKKLEKLGWVRREGRYPVRFEAKGVDEAREAQMMVTREWFEENFGSKRGKKEKLKGEKNEGLKVTFITSRKDSLEKSTKDMGSAKEEISLIVSGDEVPADTMLANRKALDRGVRIRILVQKVDAGNREMIGNWQRMGMEVRRVDTIETRVIIIDERVVYLVSYNPKVNEEGVGVRIEYKPIAQLMKEVFDRKWDKSRGLQNNN